MKNYEKPIVLLNSDLSEGVYTASGDISTNGVIESFNEPTRGEYHVKIKNRNGESVNTLTLILYKYGDVTSVTSSSAGLSCYDIDDRRVLLSYSSPNKINDGEFTQELIVIVTGNGDFYGLKVED